MMCKYKRSIILITLLCFLLLLAACSASKGDTTEKTLAPQATEPITKESEKNDTLEEQVMKIKVTDGNHTVIFELNDTPSAKSLYEMLPIDVSVENYSTNEKIFYTDEKIDTDGGIEGNCKAGTLALFSPWGNVVMFYGPFRSYPGLYILGEAIEGTGQIKKLSGTVHVEAED